MTAHEKIAIYEFGRIGRQCLKVALRNGLFLPAALTDTKDEETLAALFAVDTTNALAPVVKVIREHCGIRCGFFSTVHSYTNSQSLADHPVKDRRDSWAAAENIIPSWSGAARALGFIWQDLPITGKAYRVPTRTGSIAELNLVTRKPCTVSEVNELLRRAAMQGPLYVRTTAPMHRPGNAC